MSQNTCRVVIRKEKATTMSKGIFCTADIDLHVFMLTYQI